MYFRDRQKGSICRLRTDGEICIAVSVWDDLAGCRIGPFSTDESQIELIVDGTLRVPNASVFNEFNGEEVFHKEGNLRHTECAVYIGEKTKRLTMITCRHLVGTGSVDRGSAAADPASRHR
jgi:hypothetical protein